MSNIIATVYKAGGTFKSEYVYKLFNNVRMYTDMEFVCISDEKNVPGYIPLEHNFPKWWSKIELFRPGIFKDDDKVLYLDLDTIILENPKPLFDFLSGTVMLKDINLNTPASGIMLWEGNTMQFIYDSFIKCKDPMNKRHKINHKQKVYGDQSWIEKQLIEKNHSYKYFQDQHKTRSLLPWPDYRNNKPDHCMMVYFYGVMKPWNCHGWASDFYKTL